MSVEPWIVVEMGYELPGVTEARRHAVMGALGMPMLKAASEFCASLEGTELKKKLRVSKLVVWVSYYDDFEVPLPVIEIRRRTSRTLGINLFRAGSWIRNAEDLLERVNDEFFEVFRMLRDDLPSCPGALLDA